MGVEGDDRVENVTTFRYLERPLDQTYDDWTAVRRNIMRARLVWGDWVHCFDIRGQNPKCRKVSTGQWCR